MQSLPRARSCTCCLVGLVRVCLPSSQRVIPAAKTCCCCGNLLLLSCAPPNTATSCPAAVYCWCVASLATAVAITACEAACCMNLLLVLLFPGVTHAASSCPVVCCRDQEPQCPQPHKHPREGHSLLAIWLQGPHQPGVCHHAAGLHWCAGRSLQACRCATCQHTFCAQH